MAAAWPAGGVTGRVSQPGSIGAAFGACFITGTGITGTLADAAASASAGRPKGLNADCAEPKIPGLAGTTEFSSPPKAALWERITGFSP